MLERIKVSSFKSLVNFDLKLGKFNCIIGLNGAGKSSVLQLISYISSLFQGNAQQWLDTRGWDAKEVVSHFFPTRKTIEFSLTYSFEDKSYLWTGVFNWQDGKCTRESFFELVDSGENRIIYRVVNGQIRIGKEKIDITFKHSGSILSALNDDVMPHEAKRFRDYLIQIESHELLSPKVMRLGSYSKQGRLGSAGEYLIHHLHKHYDSAELEVLRIKLSEYFPQVFKLETKPLETGNLTLLITERFYDENGDKVDIETDAKHINDGMLRLLNIIVNQTDNSFGFQLFDEIENGVNPEITETLMDSLVSSHQQTLITTHSPVILNYLDDSVATEGVIYLYKTKGGITQAIRFFDIPAMRKKLTVMGPGEVYEDTTLDNLIKEIENLPVHKTGGEC